MSLDIKEEPALKVILFFRPEAEPLARTPRVPLDFLLQHLVLILRKTKAVVTKEKKGFFRGWRLKKRK